MTGERRASRLPYSRSGDEPAIFISGTSETRATQREFHETSAKQRRPTFRSRGRDRKTRSLPTQVPCLAAPVQSSPRLTMSEPVRSIGTRAYRHGPTACQAQERSIGPPVANTSRTSLQPPRRARALCSSCVHHRYELPYADVEPTSSMNRISPAAPWTSTPTQSPAHANSMRWVPGVSRARMKL